MSANSKSHRAERDRLVQELELAARREERRLLLAIVEQWSEDRGVGVRELLFRMRTASRTDE